MRSINNSEDVIDSRDVIARLEELMDMAEDDEDTAEEFSQLKALNEEGEQTFGREWRDGVGLVRDGYFVRYAKQFAEDIGAIQHDTDWLNNHIDWKAAAADLQQDYSSIEFNGETYWGRG